jgi:deazaflavin-dependent oxidoreductase (nitroreductase family)
VQLIRRLLKTVSPTLDLSQFATRPRDRLDNNLAELAVYAECPRTARSGGTVRSMPLRYVDPHKKRGPIYRATVRFGRTRAGQFLGHHFSPHVDPWVSRLTNGRGLGPVVNAPLITTGAKSGQPRQVFVAYFHEGRDPIVIASNYGGPTHPQWYYNLKAHAECKFGGDRFQATEVIDHDIGHPLQLRRVRAAVFACATGQCRMVGRQIPIFRLKPR